jgi:uncharacterized protein with HEPN domain
MRDYKLYLKDILAALESIEGFVEGMDFESFKKDDKTSSAVVRKFEIIGEAAKNIPGRVKDEYKSVPWKEMAGMRDRLIHLYFGVDYELVWKTIKNRLPALKAPLMEVFEKGRFNG